MTSSAPPKVTILLPVYNAERFLAQCIESLLNQTFINFELLIINDGSTDQTAEICESYHDPRIRLVHNPGNQGVTYTLNRGIELASAQLIARMDADDVAMSNRLALQVAYMEANPNVAVVASQMLYIDQAGTPLTHNRQELQKGQNLDWTILFRNPIAHPTVMFRTDLARAVNGYGLKETYVEDYDLWSRLYKNHAIHVLSEELIVYRIHPSSVSNKHAFKQGIEASSIAQRNMEDFLSKAVNPIEARLLFYAYQGYRVHYPEPEIFNALALLNMIYTKFLAQHQPQAQTHKNIHQDTQRMILNLLLSLPYNQRIQGLSQAFVQQVLSPTQSIQALFDWKSLAKKLLRKPIALPISPPPPGFKSSQPVHKELVS